MDKPNRAFKQIGYYLFVYLKTLCQQMRIVWNRDGRLIKNRMWDKSMATQCAGDQVISIQHSIQNVPASISTVTTNIWHKNKTSVSAMRTSHRKTGREIPKRRIYNTRLRQRTIFNITLATLLATVTSPQIILCLKHMLDDCVGFGNTVCTSSSRVHM
jgi:hypothetical protein